MKPEVINSGNGLELENSRHPFSLWEFWILEWKQEAAANSDGKKVFDDDHSKEMFFLPCVYRLFLNIIYNSFSEPRQVKVSKTRYDSRRIE